MDGTPPTTHKEALRRLKINAQKEREEYARKRRSPVYWMGLLASSSWRLVRKIICIICSFVWRYTAGRWIYIKVTGRPSHTEAATLRFVKAHTTIPVPTVLAQFSWRSLNYLFMTRAGGVPLEWTWHSLSDLQRQKVVAQLADYVAQLRRLPSPDDERIHSVAGGPVRDSRAYEGPECGPFRDEQHFNLQLRNGLTVEDLSHCCPTLASVHNKRHPIVFTHGDLAPRNIMVAGTKVTALIDWECAGWYPAHWEYCKAFWASFGPDHTSWAAFFPQFIPSFYEEAEADIRLWEERWVPSVRV